jgi:acyl-CoA reductase-like NAD-dependent aldehyde dehydrogenase
VLVTPWNFPLAMGARKLAPALAAGVHPRGAVRRRQGVRLRAGGREGIEEYLALKHVGIVTSA